MKKFVFILLAFVSILSLSSCKKAIEAAKEQAVVDAITDGTWYISRFVEGGTDITASFAGWEFVFYSNGTSLGTKTGSPNVTGTWVGDAATFSFTTTFTSSTVPAPLPKVGGTWVVTRAVSTSKGSYARTVGGVYYEMDMTKK
jgi:hypothetical protein